MRRWLATPLTVLAIVLVAILVSGSGAGLPLPAPRAAPRAATVGASPPAPPPPILCVAPAPSAPSVTLDPGLRASGEPIRAVQSALGITADGVFGPATATAVQAFVLPIDGCTITTAQQTALDALTALTSAQDELTAQAAAARARNATSAVASPPRMSQSGGSVQAFLDCTKEIESHGNYEDVDSTQTYWGAYQFDQPTWNGAVTRAGFPQWAGQPPNGAPPAVQDAAAIQLYSERGNQPWGGRC